MENDDEILILAAEAARLNLECGGETYRAEDAARVFAKAFGAEGPECFAMPTGAILSIRDARGRVRSIVKRISKRSIDLGALARLDSLSRRVAAGRATEDQARSELAAIANRKPRNPWLGAIGLSAVATFFSLLFGGGWEEALCAAVLGLALAGGLAAAKRLIGFRDFFLDAWGGAQTAFLATIAAALVPGLRADIIVIGTLMSLVPGTAIVTAIRDVIARDLVAGVARGAEAFMSAAALALGTAGGLSLAGLLTGAIFRAAGGAA
jgi:uncharacterized membrane protein YjjP (DUF1212 family)